LLRHGATVLAGCSKRRNLPDRGECHCNFQGEGGAPIRTILGQQVKSLTSLTAILQCDAYHRRIGKVYSWKATGFGFISETGFDKDIYIHISDVLDGSVSDIPEGTFVEYDLIEGPKGPKAVNVVVLH
jgi:CspA family cold shock protein